VNSCLGEELMSKFSDLKYYLQMLAGDIEDITDSDVRENAQKSFESVESCIDDIESELNSVQYTINSIM
jgi:hypothetical protein